MSKKINLNKLSPQELLAYAQNLVKQEKSKPSPKSKPVKSITIKPSKIYHKYCHHPVKYLITQKKLYR